MASRVLADGPSSSSFSGSYFSDLINADEVAK
jgi:hypothetical protein